MSYDRIAELEALVERKDHLLQRAISVMTRQERLIDTLRARHVSMHDQMEAWAAERTAVHRCKALVSSAVVRLDACTRWLARRIRG